MASTLTFSCQIIYCYCNKTINSKAIKLSEELSVVLLNVHWQQTVPKVEQHMDSIVNQENIGAHTSTSRLQDLAESCCHFHVVRDGTEILSYRHTMWWPGCSNWSDKLYSYVSVMQMNTIRNRTELGRSTVCEEQMAVQHKFSTWGEKDKTHQIFQSCLGQTAETLMLTPLNSWDTLVSTLSFIDSLLSVPLYVWTFN